MTKLPAKLFNSKLLVRFVFVTFMASSAFILFRLGMPPSAAVEPGMAISVKNDYSLMLVQCVLGMVVMLLPGLLQKKLYMAIPSKMLVAFAVFLYCAIYLGEVHFFYFRIPHWDTLLHIFSGFALSAIGISIISLLNKSESIKMPLSPAFVAIFAFCFALAAGVVWEIYEFAMDSLLGFNMQKYMLESGEALVGQAALADTMKDLIADSLGAIAMSVVGYVSMKHKTGWLENMQIKLNRPAVAPEPVFLAQNKYDMLKEATSNK